MNRIKAWWWGMPSTQRAALFLVPAAGIAFLLLQRQYGF
jgi:hypothetical protein